MGPEDRIEEGTLRTQGIRAQFRLPSAPEGRRQAMGEKLAGQVAPNRPSRRAGRMVPDERDRPDEGERHRGKDPIGKLLPVRDMNGMKRLRIEQFPRPKDIEFVRPDGAHIVEGQGQIREQKDCSTIDQYPASRSTTLRNSLPAMNRRRLSAKILRT